MRAHLAGHRTGRRPASPWPRPWAAGLLAVALLLPAAASAVTYADRLGEAGIAFRLAGEVSPGNFVDLWPGFPEIFGGGACWADVDGDGYDDLFLVNQQFNPENPNTDGWRASQDPHHKLYRNLGDGTFGDVSSASGADGRNFGYGCSAADYDGDGHVDLFVSAYGDAQFGGNQLFRNLGDGTFADVAQEAGVAMLGACGEFACMATSSAWADYDHDGDLDLYVGTYVETTLTDSNRGPQLHTAQTNRLFRNEADGSFTEVAAQAGVAGNPTDADGAKTLGVVWFDHDLDGDLDLYVANDEEPNDFYDNQGDGTFAERSDASGLADDRAGMGLGVRDYDNDGYPDVFITHYETEQNGFYRNNGDGTFEDRSGEDDLTNSLDWVGWGTDFVDVDRDMDLDIVVANGHTGPTPTGYPQVTQVFRNDPEGPGADPWDRRWVDVSDTSGPGLTVARVTRGAAFADFDHDGDTDMALVNNRNESAQLLVAEGVANGWLTLRLEQPGMNRFAVGARVALEAGGVVQWREVQAGSSYLSQNTLNLEFGLGSHARADRITVHWPSGGGTTVVEDVPAGHVVRIERATGHAALDTIAPATELAIEGLAGLRGWWRSPVEAGVTARDRGPGHQSGVVVVERSLDAGATWEDAMEASPLAYAEQGVHRLLAYSRDAAGNQEPVRRLEVRLDFEPPATAHEVEGIVAEQGWVVGDEVRVRLEASDAVSGLHGIRYRIDGGAWQAYAEPVVLTEQGEHLFEYTAEDVAGNTAGVTAVPIKLDNTPPVVALLRPLPGAVYLGDEEVASAGLEEASDAPAVLVALPDAAGAGVGGLRFRVAAEAWDAVSGMSRVTFVLDDQVQRTDFAPPYEWVWDAGGALPGIHHVQAIAVDVAGNQAVAGVDVLRLAAAPAAP